MISQPRNKHLSNVVLMLALLLSVRWIYVNVAVRVWLGAHPLTSVTLDMGRVSPFKCCKYIIYVTSAMNNYV